MLSVKEYPVLKSLEINCCFRLSFVNGVSVCGIPEAAYRKAREISVKNKMDPEISIFLRFL